MSPHRTAQSANYDPSLPSFSSSRLGPNDLLSDFYSERHYVYDRRRLRYLATAALVLFTHTHTIYMGLYVRNGRGGCGTALEAGRSLVRFPIVSLEFFIDIILPAALWPCGCLGL